MNNITNFQNSFGEEIGSINVSIFKNDYGISSFKLDTENDDVLQVSYVIEDTLRLTLVSLSLFCLPPVASS